VGGDAEEVQAAGGVLGDAERIEPMQGEGAEVKHVAGEDRVSLSDLAAPVEPDASTAGVVSHERRG
jgi:hypothetical protein